MPTRSSSNKPRNNSRANANSKKSTNPNRSKGTNGKSGRKDNISPSTALKELESQSLADLRKLAERLKIAKYKDYKKSDLVIKILEEQTKKGGNIFAEGVLEVINDGSHGVLRSLDMMPGENDVYVSGSQIKRFNLRQGDYISGQARPPKDGERYLSMLKIEAINGASPETAISRPSFRKLTPVFPDEQIKLETDQHTLSTRVLDLLAPIGKGQRAMVVAQPKGGKTWLLKDIANGISQNHPEAHLMVLLVGERPEEVTDMRRSVNGEVVAGTFDEPPQTHTRISEMTIDRAKRLVEQGKDVVILMDSITRLARAYNIVAPPSGRTLSGGFDPTAIFPPKKFFGAARNIEEGGSLTVIATALVDTGSKMDDVIFEEFKGTGNMEVKLDRRLAQKRIYPSIDIAKSGTRNEDKLLEGEMKTQSWRVRRMVEALIQTTNQSDAVDQFLNKLKKTKNNEEFIATLHEM